ncbi:MAG: PEF-CTERM sorting domain-containing protein [ANME-2 cluster archaeon]|nr:PEF-CTERM sorting domain-containing protein [ANME-2 cluster archaeon]
MNKLIISALLIFGLAGMIGTAGASFAYGVVLDSDGSTLVNGATVKAFDINNDVELGSSVTGIDGRYSIDLGSYDKSQVNVTAQLSDKTGKTIANVDIFGTLILYRADVTMDIPEFPTIALPVAALLGLMFIISSRKKEE